MTRSLTCYEYLYGEAVVRELLNMHRGNAYEQNIRACFKCFLRHSRQALVVYFFFFDVLDEVFRDEAPEDEPAGLLTEDADLTEEELEEEEGRFFGCLLF